MKIQEEVLDHLTEECRYIRQTVFVDEQGFQVEFDQLDDTAVHFLICVDGHPAATARMMTGETGEYIIGRVAVLPQYRSDHLGSRIMQLAHREAERRGGKKTVVSAQCRVQPFYESLGYVASGAIYLDEFCEHIHMEKVL